MRFCRERIKLNGDELSIEIKRRELTGARPEARRFAQDGAHLGLIARGLNGLSGARGDVETLGGQAIVCQADVADA